MPPHRCERQSVRPVWLVVERAQCKIEVREFVRCATRRPRSKSRMLRTDYVPYRRGRLWMLHVRTSAAALHDRLQQHTTQNNSILHALQIKEIKTTHAQIEMPITFRGWALVPDINKWLIRSEDPTQHVFKYVFLRPLIEAAPPKNSVSLIDGQ